MVEKYLLVILHSDWLEMQVSYTVREAEKRFLNRDLSHCPQLQHLANKTVLAALNGALCG